VRDDRPLTVEAAARYLGIPASRIVDLYHREDVDVWVFLLDDDGQVSVSGYDLVYEDSVTRAFRLATLGQHERAETS
jgi:hypothetical protein